MHSFHPSSSHPCAIRHISPLIFPSIIHLLSFQRHHADLHAMSIRPLPKDAVDKIKSSSAITSLNEVVCGLFRNSLDACSTKVNIHLDYVLGNCTVHDNGHGIVPDDFKHEGGLGKLHRKTTISAHFTATK